MNAKVGTLDIETSPYECYTWGLWDQNIGVEQIKTERTVLSFCWKPLRSRKLIYMDSQGAPREDLGVLQALWSVLDDADIVIAQNGKKFDLKVINARMAMLDLPPYSPVRVIDTCEVAKRHFGFGSNKLAWLSKHLTDSPKDDHRKFPGMELWLECLKDNPKAWEEMRKYNIQDVIATEKLYLKLRPWIANHPNLGVYVDGKLTACPNCGSTHVQRRGEAKTQTSSYPRFHCQDCGKWSKGKEMLTPIAHRKTRLI